MNFSFRQSSVATRGLHAFVGLVALVSPCTAFAANLPGQVSCPVVASKKSGEYQALSNKEFICFANTRSVKVLGYAKSRLFIPGGFRAEQSFSLQGIGENISPVFRVARTSAVVNYSYTGKGDFEIEVLDQSTGSKIGSIARSKGPVASTTYVNFSGLFFLRIKGDNEAVAEGVADPLWTVVLTSE